MKVNAAQQNYKNVNIFMIWLRTSHHHNWTPIKLRVLKNINISQAASRRFLWVQIDLMEVIPVVLNTVATVKGNKTNRINLIIRILCRKNTKLHCRTLFLLKVFKYLLFLLILLSLKLRINPSQYHNYF